MIPENVHLNIGSLLFEDLDQIDLTGPFEVLSRLPNATHRIYAKSRDPVRDVMGLRIMPDATLAEAPQLDILHVPGGPGQQALMEDEEVLGAAFADMPFLGHEDRLVEPVEKGLGLGERAADVDARRL